jgi:hypothetical protein
VARHNYAAENTMKHFRDALLKSQTKRIELIEVYTWLKLDRHLKGGKFRAGWGCPGISKLPRGVVESGRKILTIRARNVRKRHWVRRAQKRNLKRKATAKKEAELAAAVAKAAAEVRERSFVKVSRWAGSTSYKAGPWIGQGADRRRIVVADGKAEVLTHNMATKVCKEEGYSVSFCENFCRVHNLLPAHLSPFPTCAQEYKDAGVYAGLSQEQTMALIANRLLPIGASDTAGSREGGVPDVKRTHAEKLKCVAAVLKVHRKMQWPRAMPRARVQPQRFRDADADAEEPSGGAEVWLTLDVPAASTDNDGTDGSNDADTNDITEEGSDDETDATVAEADEDTAMAEPDDGLDASDSDSDASNDEFDGCSSDDDL